MMTATMALEPSDLADIKQSAETRKTPWQVLHKVMRSELSRIKLLWSVFFVAFYAGGEISRLHAAETSPLPITRVVLFRGGVGFIERSGSVDGKTALTLNFKEEQINDLLKSLILQDLDGGKIMPVVYNSKDPLARRLKSFAIDISDNPALPELLNRIRGVSITVKLASQSQSGAVVGVEKREIFDPEHKLYVPQYFLHLAVGKGLQSIPFDQVQAVELNDERLQGELQQALNALAGNLDTTRKTMRLEFMGTGQRRVRVGYLVEMPVWKMSYRLVLQDNKKLFLQGWGIVENTSDEDWDNVSLALVSGRPISFTQDLYQPLYVPRPDVPPKLYSSLRPQAYERDMAVGDRVEPERQQRGGGTRELKNLKRAANAPMMSMAAPMESMMMAKDEEADYDRGYMAANDFASTGVTGMAATADLGALFEYRIDQPVSLPRQQSALIPIVNQEVTGESVSVYNVAIQPRHPLYGLRLNNTTDITLMGGPITVYAHGAYGGDALIDDLEAGGNTLLTYALDLQVEVKSESLATDLIVVSMKIIHGVMELTNKWRSSQRYAMTNRDDAARVLLLEHPVKSGWNLVEPKTADETTAQFYRFRQDLAAGKAATLNVVEEQTYQQTIDLRHLTPDQVELYLQNPVMTDRLKTVLREIIKRQQELAALENDINLRRQQINAIGQDQSRIRDNMNRLDRNADLYNQYVAKLAAQEKDIEQLMSQIDASQENLKAKRQSLADYLADLEVE